MLITRRHGSWVVLGTLVTDVEIEPTPPLELDCGECRLCIDACPTDALDDAGHARRHPLPLVLDAGARPDPGRIPRAARRHGLRLRHLPGRLPVEPRRREAATRRAARAGGADRLARRLAEAGAADLAARYDRLYVPRNDAALPAPERARRARQHGRGRGCRAGRAVRRRRRRRSCASTRSGHSPACGSRGRRMSHEQRVHGRALARLGPARRGPVRRLPGARHRAVPAGREGVWTWATTARPRGRGGHPVRPARRKDLSPPAARATRAAPPSPSTSRSSRRSSSRCTSRARPHRSGRC